MFENIKTFERNFPVNECFRNNISSICNRITKKAAIKEMELVCKAMTEHDDYDINHYRIISKPIDDNVGETFSFSVEITIEYIPDDAKSEELK